LYRYNDDRVLETGIEATAWARTSSLCLCRLRLYHNAIFCLKRVV